MTPLKAIRLKCLDCCCGQAKEVKLCPCESCSLYLFRFGKNPNRAGMGNAASFAKNHDSTSDSADNSVEMGKDIPQHLDSGAEA